LKAAMRKENVIKLYNSNLDDSVQLVSVLGTTAHYVVRVLGEPDIHFPSEHEALSYAEKKANEF
jgi:hypothetical protein